MPEESKRNNEKKRNDPKEQRRPRHGRNQAAQEKKFDKKETPKPVPKVPEKPVYEEPGPEFYKNLKRETEEILKITEEESTKYKKKEIQSNWAKYEMPIESYDDIEDQENLGADYEKLIQAPLSVGGHFQFKHEKSWDSNVGPSPYDRYFAINMDNLAIALCTIPFNERNSIEKSLFTDSDNLTINNRATKYKQKYFNDKSFTTPEMKAQESILSKLNDSNVTKIELDQQENINTNLKHNLNETNIEFEPEIIEAKKSDEQSIETENISHEIDNAMKLDVPTKELNTISADTINIDKESPVKIKASVDKKIDDFDEFIFGTPASVPQSSVGHNSKVENEKTRSIVKEDPQTVKTNPVIESPEDLEKWLDDFLDG